MAEQLPAFAIVPGDVPSAVVLHVPHAGTRIPAEARTSILLDDAALAAELRAMTDAHTDRIAFAAAGAVPQRPWAFVNRLSRLVIDPERFTDEREEMRAVGMGAVYTGTSQLTRLRDHDPDREQKLINAYFTPYAEALADLVDARLTACGQVTIIDVHSYPHVPLPYERHAELDRPAICLGTDADHTPDSLVQHARAAFEPVGPVAINAPFLGTYVPTRHYGRDRRVSSIMIEIRRDGYLDQSGEPTDGLDRLASGLATLIQAIG